MAAPSTPRDVAVFIDGTWNRQGTGAPTNVRKLYEAAARGPVHGRSVAKLYLSGVGTKPQAHGEALLDAEYRAHLALHLDRELARGAGWTRSATGGAFGKGTTARIKAAYRAVCAEFDRHRGDRVFLFGFSRGAFAARSLAGFMEKVGLLLRDKLWAVDEAYWLYEYGVDASQSALAEFLYKLTGRRMPTSDDDAWLPVHFLGVWDTVGSLGLPSRLARLSAPFTEYHQVDVPPNVMHARHGLALHELRETFEPLLWSGGSHGSLAQVWFPGAHADVGGGYPAGETGLADAALLWMADQAEAHGLALDRSSAWLHPEAADACVHHEIRGVFVASLPRPRRWLSAADLDADAARSFRFHASAGARLFASTRPQYGYRQPFVNAALRRADELAAVRMVQMRLAQTSRDLPSAKAADAPAEAAGWWRTVTLDELARSEARVAAMLDPNADQEIDAMASARALAIRQLCIDGAVIATTLDAAIARTLEQDRALRAGGEKAAADAWLDRCQPLGEAVRTSIGLLAARDLDAAQAQLRHFDAAASDLHGDLIDLAFTGRIRSASFHWER